MAFRKRACLAVMAAMLWGGRIPAAQAAESAYDLSFELDVPLLLLAGSAAGSYLVMNEAPPPHCAPLCDRANVNPFDRPFAGVYDKNWQTVGDIATASTLLLVPGGLLLGEPSRAGLRDLVVVGEAVLVTSAVQVTMAYAVDRPRPRVYGEEAPLSERTDANAARSFFSGHVANCLAGTMVATTALWRTDHPRLGWAVLVAGLTGSAVVGVARIAAGGHFPSDVLIGYAVGAGVGIAIPALHDKKLQPTALALPNAAGLGIRGTF
jgi:membrane-associated phospholipid phosphatase